MKQYNRKQISNAIAYWKQLLESADFIDAEDGISEQFVYDIGNQLHTLESIIENSSNPEISKTYQRIKRIADEFDAFEKAIEPYMSVEQPSDDILDVSHKNNPF